MNNDSKARFSDPDLWIRLLYMILFAALTWLSRLVLCVIGLLQFLVVLVSGEENRSLRDFSASLAEWTLRAFRFVCFNSEQKPFPFDEWPEPDRPVPAAAIVTASATASGDTATGTAVQTVETEVEGGLTAVETTVVEVEIDEIDECDSGAESADDKAGDDRTADDETDSAEQGGDSDTRPQP